MTPENFCYWLKGYFEILAADKNKEHVGVSMSMEQTLCVQTHLDYVFAPKVTQETTPVKPGSGADFSGILSGSGFPWTSIC